MSNRNYLGFIPLIFLFYTVTILSCSNNKKPYEDWTTYGGSTENIHYSALKEIDTNNINNLKPEWIYNTGDLDNSSTQMQVNPIIVDSFLYAVSPKLKLFALNAATGKSKWIFDPFDSTLSVINKAKGFGINACRGVTYFDSSGK